MRTPRALWAAVLAAALAGAAPASAQVYTDEVPTYSVTGRLFLSYDGAWATPSERPASHHLLVEGGELTLRGWLWESRYVKFRATLLATRIDEPGVGGHAYALGYGATLFLLSRSILPLTGGVTQGLSVAGSSAEASAALTTTTYSASAQLVSPELPHVDVRAQRVDTAGQDGSRTASDSVVASVYGTAPLQRYAAVFSWNADQYRSQPRASYSVASITDDIQPSPGTLGHLSATVTQGGGAQGGGGGFMGYQASASALSRLTADVVLRTAYGYAQASSASVNETSNTLSAGSTIHLGGSGLLLGEGLAAGAVTTDSDQLHRSVRSVSASQGVASSGRVGPLDLAGSVTGQAGYSSVSDGSSGPLLGYSGALSAQLPVAGAPLRGYAQYSVREDRSSADLSSRTFSANVTSALSGLGPVMILPYATFLHVERSDPTSPTGQTDSSAAAATVSGFAPLLRSTVAFAAGYSDTWSHSSGTRSTLFFGRLSDAVRVGASTFANVTLDLSHRLGGTTDASVLASAVWSFRESQLSLSYTYDRAWPGADGQHSIAAVYSRGFGATFLPEAR